MSSQAIIAVEFDAGHDVINPHKHRFRIEVAACGDTQAAGEAEGMVVDFRHLSRALNDRVKRPLEGRMIIGPNGLEAPNHFDMPILEFDVRPTAENLARWAFEQVVEDLPGPLAEYVECVTVWETPYAAGSYRP